MTLTEYIESLRGMRVCVIGLGVSNRPLLELLLDGGCTVTACDRASREELGNTADSWEERGCVLCFGENYLKNLDFDVIFRTPGLHPNVPELAAARERGATVTSEMEAFFRLCPCHTIAVTGSDGKTTTTTIISELLKAAGKTVWLGGNIGTPLLDKLPEMREEDYAVLELSSFQLHSMVCHPETAVITNISPNHLDIHPGYEDYITAKKQIFLRQNQSNALVLNADNELTRSFAAESYASVRFFSRQESVKAGVFLRDDVIYRAENGVETAIMPISEIRLPGIHNVENFMTAFAATEGIVPDEVCRSVARSFAGVAHRLEMLRTVRGVQYCNDSIASSPTRTIAGLRSFTRKPILIAGGYDKNIPFDELGNEVCRRAKALVLTGDTSQKIYAAVTASPLFNAEKLPVLCREDFRDAVLSAAELAEEGDTVLLSPACASFDHFKNFAVRGNFFREIVNELE